MSCAGPSLQLLATAIFCAMLLAPLSIYLGFVSSTVEGYNMLGIAGDLVECASPNWHRKLSIINIKEIAKSDDDRPEGFQMDIFKLSSDAIDNNLKTYTDDNLNMEQGFDSSGSKKFIIPFAYYSEPLYMWYGSSISISYNLSYSQKPSEAVLYLIKGDEEINKFFSGDKFCHEKRFDLLLYDSGQIHWKVSNNGYYFLAVHMNVENGTVFLFNVTFMFKDIDPGDFSGWIQESAKTIGGVGSTTTLTHSLKSPNSNHTLCYLHPKESTGSSRIHLDVSFRPELITWIIPALILTVICLLYFSFLFLCPKYILR